MSAGSLGFDDKISHISVNTTFEELPRKIKVRTEEAELYRSFRKKKYQSVDHRTEPIKSID